MNRLSEEQITKNFERFEALLMRTSRADALRLMLDEMGTRIATAPASSRVDYHAAYVGGLVDHSLRVLDNAMLLKKSVPLFSTVPAESIVLASLLHDIGKVGEPGADGGDYYVEQDSDWHREKLGQVYKNNDAIPFMKNSLRGIFTLQHYCVKLSEDEFKAIYLNDGFVEDANKPYCLKEGLLAALVHQADYTTTLYEKANKI